MDAETKAEHIAKIKAWFNDEFIKTHYKNIEKLSVLKEFNVNPFTWPYLATFMEDEDQSRALARALILPRALGSSISTSFGTRIQQLVTRNFDNVKGSQISGIDFEFVDQVDMRLKYCQLKAGPNVVNKEDVEPIKETFAKARRLAKTNNLKVDMEDYVFALFYGHRSEINNFIQAIDEDNTVLVGAEFWHRLTGDENFYEDLVMEINDLAEELDSRKILETTIAKLATDIRKHQLG